MNWLSLEPFLPVSLESADVDVRRRSRVLAAFTLLLLGCTGILLVAAVGVGLWQNALGLSLSVVGSVTVLVSLRRGGSLAILATVIALTMFGAATQGAVVMGGQGAPPLNWYSVLPLLVLLVGGPRLGMGFAALGVLGHTAFYVASRRGFGPATADPLARYADALVITAFVFVLALVYERFKRRALDEMRLAQERIEVLQAQLVEGAHRAGMAEVSASVLHNIGNALNHVTTSNALAKERLGGMRFDGLGKLAAKLSNEATTDDARVVAAYLSELSATLAEQREGVATELRSLASSLDHVVAVIDDQHRYVDDREHETLVDLKQTLEDVVRLERAACSHLSVEITTELEDVPPFVVSKHRVLLVFVNIFRNAVRAVEGTGRAGTIRIGLRTDAGRVYVEVADNGVGIAQENLTEVFRQGFTTKAGSRGFGLHSSAIAAVELRGSLVCHSPGEQRGATFVLELPR